MCNKYIIKRKLGRIYRESDNNSIYDRLYEDFSYFYDLKNKEERFITVEPKGSLLDRYTSNYRYYELDHIFTDISYCLLRYGMAFLVISLVNSDLQTEKDGEQQAYCLKLEEKKGILIKNGSKTYYFWCLPFGKDEPIKMILQRDNIIVFDIHELGFDRREFSGIIKKLDKYDTLKIGEMMLDPPWGYDYDSHSKNNRIKQLKITSRIGWLPYANDISNSYFLYRGIKQRQIKTRLLNYIIDKVNKGIELLLQDKDAGRIVTHIKNIDYSSLWKDYNNGLITTDELREQLY